MTRPRPMTDGDAAALLEELPKFRGSIDNVTRWLKIIAGIGIPVVLATAFIGVVLWRVTAYGNCLQDRTQVLSGPSLDRVRAQTALIDDQLANDGFRLTEANRRDLVRASASNHAYLALAVTNPPDCSLF